MQDRSIFFIFVIMHRPLSLFPNSRVSRDANSSTSSVTKGADSLAFSISDKNNSECSVLIDDGHAKVSKELQSLQVKLCDLETQIMPITMETFKNQTIKYGNRFDKNSTTEFFKRKQAHSQGKENSMQKANAGKIVSREKGRQRLGKTINKRESNIQSQTNATRNSLATECSQLIYKSKQMCNLKKEVEMMRHSLQKSQRSMSQCSQRLSASKSIIKSLKQEEKRHQRQNQRLRESLKKSESIRAKQKQVIITQRRELQRFRQMLKHVHRT